MRIFKAVWHVGARHQARPTSANNANAASRTSRQSGLAGVPRGAPLRGYARRGGRCPCFQKDGNMRIFKAVWHVGARHQARPTSANNANAASRTSRQSGLAGVPRGAPLRGYARRGGRNRRWRARFPPNETSSPCGRAHRLAKPPSATTENSVAAIEIPVAALVFTVAALVFSNRPQKKYQKFSRFFTSFAEKTLTWPRILA